MVIKIEFNHHLPDSEIYIGMNAYSSVMELQKGVRLQPQTLPNTVFPNNDYEQESQSPDLQLSTGPPSQSQQQNVGNVTEMTNLFNMLRYCCCVC